MRSTALLFIALLSASAVAQSTSSSVLVHEADSVLPQAHALYLDLHQHPELSSHETRTAALLAGKLRALGYDVTEHVGGTGIVAVLKNGAGPTVMFRTELDALPVVEKTGLPYASKVHTKNDAGQDVGVMHACGHDLHMAALYGAAEIMARTKPSWHGMLMFIGQPAEETISGAKAMVKDGLFTRFPRPDMVLALHDFNDYAAGQVALSPGYVMANADSLRIVFYGRGAHGSAPERGIDPVLMAARATVAFQAIISREIKPGDPAVITVGYIHAGTKNNIIPDDAEIGVTVRSYTPEVRQHLLDAIARVAKAEAEASGAERMPTVEHYESTAAVYNDPQLTQRVGSSLRQALGAANVEVAAPLMGSEDFSVFTAQGIPTCYYFLGVADPAQLAAAKAGGAPLPSNHSPLFAPDAEPGIRTAIASEVGVLRDLLRTGGPPSSGSGRN